MISLSLIIINDSKSRINRMRLYCSQCLFLVQTGTRAVAKVKPRHGLCILSLYNLIYSSFCDIPVLLLFYGFMFYSFTICDVSVLPFLKRDFLYGFMLYDISAICYPFNLNDETVYFLNFSYLIYLKSSDKFINVIIVRVLPTEIPPSAMIPHLLHCSDLTSTLKQSLTHTY